MFVFLRLYTRKIKEGSPLIFKLIAKEVDGGVDSLGTAKNKITQTNLLLRWHVIATENGHFTQTGLGQTQGKQHSKTESGVSGQAWRIIRRPLTALATANILDLSRR